MEIKKLVERKEEVIDDKLCNKCGKSLSVGRCGVEDCGTRAMIETPKYNYHSEYFGEGRLLIFDLCENCTIELVEQFVHPVTDIKTDTGWRHGDKIVREYDYE